MEQSLNPIERSLWCKYMNYPNTTITITQTVCGYL